MRSVPFSGSKVAQRDGSALGSVFQDSAFLNRVSSICTKSRKHARG